MLIGIGLYFSFKHESYTYLSCTENEEDRKQYIAFNDSRLLAMWDPLEEEFKQIISN